jgi:UDP-N-acetylglucosamine:LPS N-acetylglucosamine transferase
MLAFNPLPGNEERTCRWIEKWGAGIWIKKPEDLASYLTTLLAHREQLDSLRQRVRQLARPHSARDGAEAVMKLLAGSLPTGK